MLDLDEEQILRKICQDTDLLNLMKKVNITSKDDAPPHTQIALSLGINAPHSVGRLNFLLVQFKVLILEFSISIQYLETTL